jgi:hypothetical protein
MLSPDEGITVKKRNMESRDSDYDEGGFYHPILIRPDMQEWGFAYSCLTKEEYSYMESLFRGKSQFTFTYLDDDDAEKTCVARREGSSSARKDSVSKQYRNYSITIIEC